MEETLAFLEKEIEAFEKILAELSGKCYYHTIQYTTFNKKKYVD